MNGFINWGSESPEQKRIRQRWEEDLLFEQARMKAMAQQAAGAVGGGSKPETCAPELGIGGYIKFEFGEFLANGLVQLDYAGDVNDRPAYERVIIPTLFQSAIEFDSDQGEWVTYFQSEAGTLTSSSPRLVSDQWPPFQEASVTILETTCGYPDLGRYCVEYNSGGDVLNADPIPLWFDGTDTTELPNGWFSGVGAFAWVVVEGKGGWIISIDAVGQTFVPGTRDELPVGEYTIVPGVTVTISEGACEF
jgi:hypothetical protein